MSPGMGGWVSGGIIQMDSRCDPTEAIGSEPRTQLEGRCRPSSIAFQDAIAALIARSETFWTPMFFAQCAQQ